MCRERSWSDLFREKKRIKDLARVDLCCFGLQQQYKWQQLN